MSCKRVAHASNTLHVKEKNEARPSQACFGFNLKILIFIQIEFSQINFCLSKLTSYENWNLAIQTYIEHEDARCKQEGTNE